MEMLKGKVAVQVAVDAATVPARPGQVMSWSAPVPSVRRRFTAVPSGIFAPAMLTATAPGALTVTSGVRYWPPGWAGTVTPLIWVMLMEGKAKVEFAGGK
jgi:hypothetical protein